MNIHRILQFLPLTRLVFFTTDSHHAFSPVVFFLVNKKFRKKQTVAQNFGKFGVQSWIFCGICSFFFTQTGGSRRTFCTESNLRSQNPKMESIGHGKFNLAMDFWGGTPKNVDKYHPFKII